jgi:hypothetical protein
MVMVLVAGDSVFWDGTALLSFFVIVSSPRRLWRLSGGDAN